ncbi:hypothetical protein HPB49_003447 [Dermacentor silvarum]|uniref:Uncharacterized protein n=1 Tax=Dermacentor silvarum TaxID=543639 RepID=A0ACB8CUZ1_DERSI|nr:hypothetical protein HPB49_003447 [Dermacentor silvarum]
MAESALQLRAYDPEAMAWTTVPTTGDANSIVFPKIRSQALLQASERRSQDKAKMTASNGAPAAGSSVGNMNAPATRATGCKGKAFTKWKPRSMIKPAPEDYVIGTAISAYLGPERARATCVLPSRDQNIIIVHTPDIEAADRLIGDFAVNTEKGSVPLHCYLRQDGGNTCHGVIVVRNTDTTETLQHRVCWRAGTIVEIRKFGTSNKARITFAGKEKPRYVHYDNMVVSVQNYYKTIPACGQCGAVGHRADACPNLQPNTCELCGLHAPLVEVVRASHNCVPRCSVCGGAHATNSRDCAAKYRTPHGRQNERETENDAQEQKPPSWATQRPVATTRRPGETSGGDARQNRGLGQCRQKRTPGEQFGRGCFLPPSYSPPKRAERRARSNSSTQDPERDAAKKINELESKINQPLSTPSLPATEVMESELVEPKAATSAEAAFEARFEARFGAIGARFTALENQISMMVTAISKLQDTIPAMIAQQIAHSLRPSRRPGGPYKDVSGRPLKTSKRTPEVDDDDSCSLSGMEDSALLVNAGSGAASLQPNLSLSDHGEQS